MSGRRLQSVIKAVVENFAAKFAESVRSLDDAHLLELVLVVHSSIFNVAFAFAQTTRHRHRGQTWLG